MSEAIQHEAGLRRAGEVVLFTALTVGAAEGAVKLYHHFRPRRPNIPTPTEQELQRTRENLQELIVQNSGDGRLSAEQMGFVV